MAEVDFWSPTIAAYAPLGLSSPELTPKLLQKPPFRFIHDLVRSINTKYDAYTHVFQPPLDNVATIETKEQKIQYLQLMISYVEELLQVKIDVNPKKIVSGSEPEKTNILLQYIAMAVGNAQKDKERRVQQPLQSETLISPRSSSKGHNRSPSTSPRKKRSGSSTSQQRKRPGSAGSPRSTSRAFSTSEKRPGSASQNRTPPADMEAFLQKAEEPLRSSSPLPGGFDVSSLPKARKSAMNDSSAALVLTKVDAFMHKVKGYPMNLNAPPNIQEDAQSMVKMWKELHGPRSALTQSEMPEEALEKAVNRQIETIRQIQKLKAENTQIINLIENILV